MVSLVTKKLIIGDGFAPRGYSPGLGACASNRHDAKKSAQDNIRAEDLILVIYRSKCERRVTQAASRGQPLSACRLTLQISDKYKNSTRFARMVYGWQANRK
jgi:hypothetical protein